ncbi:MAG: transposase family protein [Ktedonobacteraceae bacterium]
MQYSESSMNCRKGTDEKPLKLEEWQSMLEPVNDPRRKQGRRYSLSSIVLLALAAILSNHVSELAIAEWGASQSEEVKHALGFHNGITPHQSTIHRLFRRLNEEEVEAAFRRFFAHSFATEQQERGTWAVAIDGKAQRGRLPFEAEGAYPMHAVSVVDHQTGIVLTQGHVEHTDPQPKQVPAKTDPQVKKAEAIPPAKNKPRTKKTKGQPTEDTDKKKQEEQKMKSELAVATLLVKQIDWNGKVLTGDALYCQRCLCHALLLAGGDYLFLVKGNQPQLLEDIRVLFAPLEPAKRAGEGLLHLPEQHGSRQRREGMGGWTCAGSGCRPNSRATRIGLA